MAQVETHPVDYIWVAGTSGVGKATCIRSVIDGTDKRLMEILGISKSVHAYGPGFNIDSVDDLANASFAHAIIKWQFRTHKNILRVIEQRPESRHRAFLLWRPYEVQINDLRNRSPQLLHDTADTLQFDWGIIKKIFCKLKSENALEVSVINMQNTPCTILEQWP